MGCLSCCQYIYVLLILCGGLLSLCELWDIILRVVDVEDMSWDCSNRVEVVCLELDLGSQYNIILGQI